jgi:hypothetical protein
MRLSVNEWGTSDVLILLAFSHSLLLKNNIKAINENNQVRVENAKFLSPNKNSIEK